MEKDLNVNQLLRIAQSTIKELDSKEKFIVKDLFRGFEWNRIYKGDRTKLGTAFHVWVMSNQQCGLKPLGKTPQNQQIYEKI